MDAAEILGWTAAALGLLGYVPYFISMLRNKTKPHAFSWLVWGILTAIAYFAQTADGAGAGAWATGFTAIACFIIVLFAIFKGEKNITRSDWIAFLTALTAIPVWYATKDPLWAIVLITIIDMIAFYPTFRKSWHKPHEEEPLAYGISGLKFFIAILALENLTVTTALYPLSLVLMNWIFVTMVFWRRKAMAIPVHNITGAPK